jgi:hypothetical protein
VVLRVIITIHTNRMRARSMQLSEFTASDMRMICSYNQASFIAPPYQPINVLAYNTHAGVAAMTGIFYKLMLQVHPSVPLVLWNTVQRMKMIAPYHLTLHGHMVTPEAWVVVPLPISKLEASSTTTAEAVAYHKYVTHPIKGRMGVHALALANPLVHAVTNCVRACASIAPEMPEPAPMDVATRRRLFADLEQLSHTANHEASDLEFAVGVVSVAVPFLRLMLRVLDSALGPGSLDPNHGIRPDLFNVPPASDPCVTQDMLVAMQSLEEEIYVYVKD